MIYLHALKNFAASKIGRAVLVFAVVLAGNAVTRWDAKRLARLEINADMREEIARREAEWQAELRRHTEEIHARLEQDEAELEKLKGMRDAIFSDDFSCRLPDDLVERLRDIN